MPAVQVDQYEEGQIMLCRIKYSILKKKDSLFLVLAFIVIRLDGHSISYVLDKDKIELLAYCTRRSIYS